MDWSPDGLGIVAAGRQDNQVICRVWDADKEDGGRHVFAGDQSNEYFTVVWSPDGKLLALRAGDKIHVARTDDWAEFWVSDLIASHNGLTWSPDSRQILVNSQSDAADGELQIFELKESKPVHVIPEPFFWQAAWNLAQDRLAIAEPREGNLKILNAADFSPVREIKSRAGWLAWLPHQPRLLSGDSGESLTVLWNTDDGQPEWCSTLLLDNKVAVFNGAGQLLPSSRPESKANCVIWSSAMIRRSRRFRSSTSTAVSPGPSSPFPAASNKHGGHCPPDRDDLSTLLGRGLRRTS